jgi:hypothetical protein
MQQGSSRNTADDKITMSPAMCRHRLQVKSEGQTMTALGKTLPMIQIEKSAYHQWGRASRDLCGSKKALHRVMYRGAQ